MAVLSIAFYLAGASETKIFFIPLVRIEPTTVAFIIKYCATTATNTLKLFIMLQEYIIPGKHFISEPSASYRHPGDLELTYSNHFPTYKIMWLSQGLYF